MTEEKDFFTKNEKFLKELAEDMGLNLQFINHIEKGRIDEKDLYWKDCTPQQIRQHFLFWIIEAEEKEANQKRSTPIKAKLKSNEIFKAYQRQYRANSQD